MVSKFWLGNTEEVPGEVNRNAKTKAQKVELVEKWLVNGRQRMRFEAGAEEMAQKYLEKRNRGRKSATKPRQVLKVDEAADEAEIGKLDDLADCLLQGMAWIKWEENRRAIVSDGPSALDVSA